MLVKAYILAIEDKIEFEDAIDKPNDYKRISVDVPLKKFKIPVYQRHDKVHQNHLEQEKDDGNENRRTSPPFLHKIALHRVESLCVFSNIFHSIIRMYNKT